MSRQFIDSKASVKDFQEEAKFESNGSSQSNFNCPKDWSKILALVITGPISPSGLNILVIVEIIYCFLCDYEIVTV
ncbi:hypothetical protein TNCV_476351 [Trichonephila clavipes]|nr:hypothetical protein TNCV_476351 [Trichonephila clavipes]